MLLSLEYLKHDLWLPLIAEDPGAVQKRIVQVGSGKINSEDAVVGIDYVGTLASLGNEWTPHEVVDCWLKSQQGMEGLIDAFLLHNIDGAKLLEPDYLTEAFVTDTLGVSNKIQAKKLIMAAKRLRKQTEDYAIGDVFDSGTSTFTLGQSKMIRAIESTVATMKLGETCRVLCRSDYAYGSESFRRRNGEAVVPPFATLCFEVSLTHC
jgi:hypothetical protein